MFSVAYYLNLCNAKIVYCVSHFCANKGHIGCLVLLEH